MKDHTPSIAIKRALVAALLSLTSAASLAGDKPPRFITDPLLGLRLDASVKLDPLPAELNILCERTPESWVSREWVFARTNDAATTYYVVSGYSKRVAPEPGQSLYEPIERGGLYAITGNKCVSDAAGEYFEAPTDDVPLPILQRLAKDLAARLVRAVGGADTLRTEIKNQRIDFDALSPELQAAFKPYFSSER